VQSTEWKPRRSLEETGGGDQGSKGGSGAESSLNKRGRPHESFTANDKPTELVRKGPLSTRGPGHQTQRIRRREQKIVEVLLAQGLVGRRRTEAEEKFNGERKGWFFKRKDVGEDRKGERRLNISNS